MKSVQYIFIVVSLFVTSASQAINLVKVQGKEDLPVEKQHALLPYAFYNDSTEFAVAAAFFGIGYLQPQTVMVANAFYSSNDSSSFFLYLQDYRLSNRWFVDLKLLTSDWGEFDSYRAGNPNFPDERAGSNDSDKDNFILSKGSDNYHRVNFRYLLPIGDGRGDPLHTFVVDQQGLLVPGYEAGAREWNPFTSGRTRFDVEAFYREQDLEDEFDNQAEFKTNGLTFFLDYDNTDYYRNPTQGSRQSLSVIRDWGMQDDDGASWTAIQFEASKYFSFGQTQSALQRVLALNLWYSDSPTWDSFDKRGEDKVFHRPPSFAGSTLGGLDRMKAYSTARFNDRSAVYYAAEYRHMPAYNPFPKIPLLKYLNIPWWQWVGFAEVGRVHDEWDYSELHKDLKWDVGAGLRVDAEGIVVRVDIAQGGEGSNVQMFIGHTF
ncbi:hypothetical protein [Echinimonas agarilytica]|uniref:Bacterial surface antigen (D15) domain-containing protein n=1 Tax=Echinimonas agarilytica TaxID=1215918 RepID=A0AA41W5G8_9GAMM|nr:hypothetical protein [Echinimonas agarilytica]MCM2679384.1 hypothetical protein [Echinimonas agarilytica]